MLIVAGAGTGKTTVITRRIAWLIAEKLAEPRQILALTFTERAALQMQGRVDELVPYGYNDAAISTFHAFGDRILREHALTAGLSDQFTVLSRPEQLIFLREHLFELPLDRYRPLGDPTRFLDALLRLISRAKDEEIAPEDYLAAAGRLTARGAADPGDEALGELAHQHAEVAAAYAAYDRLMRANDRLDFGDQVYLALRLLREHPAVLAEERSRYRFILVDEFQDTNHSQFELVKLLAGGERHLTVVGDDDQSIYRFRGAALSNILGFTGTYRRAKRVVLTDNYRSRQEILDAAYRLIRHNDPERLEVREGLDKRLRARSTQKPSAAARTDPVELLAFGTVSDEADAVADRIGQAVRAGGRFGDHAILVRGNRDADPFLRALNVARIPWRFSGTAGLYQQREVRVLVSFLRAVNDPDDSVSVYDLATSDVFGLTPGDVSRAFNAASRRRVSLAAALREAVADPSSSSFPLRQVEVMQRLLGCLDQHRGMAAERSAGEILYHFITSTGWLGRLTLEAREASDEALQNVARFFEIVRRQGSLLRDDRLPFFVQQLDTLIHAGDDPSTADPDVDDGDAVHVLTYHKAKGLEFPVVFMVSLVEDRFPSRSRADVLELPDELLSGDLRIRDQHLAEERRLFYVGMTRAQEALIFTWARDYGGRRARRLSQFVTEALDLPAAVPAEVLAPNVLEQLARHERQPRARAPAAPIRFGDRPLSLSYYQVNDYLTCPTKYRYAHVVRIPTPVTHPLVYGKALHAAVQAFHRRQMAGVSMSLEELERSFEQNWESEGFLTRAHEEARLGAGREALRRFWLAQQDDPAKPASVEEEFSFPLGRDRVRGRYDRVDRDESGRVTITDYKSSDVRDPVTANRRARESLQLSIYALAYEAANGRPPDELALHFLESGLVGRSEAGERRLERAKEKIVATAEGIRAGAFAATPGPTQCGYCPYRDICPDASR